jgi:hypothetical protein
MGVNQNVKELADPKKAGDVELYGRIVELEGEVIELTRQLRVAEQKVEHLQAKPTTTAKLTFHEPFYYAADESVPYCPRCFEARKLAVHLHRVFTHSERTRYDCKHCGKLYLVERTAGRRNRFQSSVYTQ